MSKSIVVIGAGPGGYVAAIRAAQMGAEVTLIDLIGEATLAILTGCTIRDLAETVHAHPTMAEIFLETSYKALDRHVHG